MSSRTLPLLPALLALCACASADPGTAPFLSGPFGTLATGPEALARRGAVEIAVKTDLAALLADIDAGGGPALTRAYDAAGVPAEHRATRTIQLRGSRDLYAANPGALVTALTVYGGQSSSVVM